jgi:hypothetical protein
MRVARSSGSSFIASSNNSRADFAMRRSYHSGGPVAVPQSACVLNGVAIDDTHDLTHGAWGRGCCLSSGEQDPENQTNQADRIQ